jgi:hypothetical protein
MLAARVVLKPERDGLAVLVQKKRVAQVALGVPFAFGDLLPLDLHQRVAADGHNGG